MKNTISVSPTRFLSILILSFSIGLILPMVACSSEKPQHAKVVKYPKKQKQYKQEPETPVHVLVRKFSKYLP